MNSEGPLARGALRRSRGGGYAGRLQLVEVVFLVVEVVLVIEVVVIVVVLVVIEEIVEIVVFLVLVVVACGPAVVEILVFVASQRGRQRLHRSGLSVVVAQKGFAAVTHRACPGA
jgi:hypothetical protein